MIPVASLYRFVFIGGCLTSYISMRSVCTARRGTSGTSRKRVNPRAFILAWGVCWHVQRKTSVALQSCAPYLSSVTFHPCAKASSYASAVRVAKSVVKDFGASGASASGGITQLASSNERSAERDTHNLMVKKLRLSLPVPLSDLGKKKVLKHKILRLRDWFEFLVNKRCFHIICGLQKPDEKREESILSAFWQRLRESQPDHPVYELQASGALNLSRCAPLLWHGDEGRGRRRSPFLVTSFLSLLGRGVRTGLHFQEKQKVRKPFLKMQPNFIGHTYTTRFLQTAMPKSVYQNDEVFQAVLQNVVSEAHHMQTAGVKHGYSGKRYWCIILGITGDWAFLQKAGNFGRSYMNVSKHLSEDSERGGICHLCLAGRHQHPFEEIHVRSPSWLNTVGAETPFRDPAVLAALPHSPAGGACKLFKFDFWHSWHLGLGKFFVGSCLAIMSEQYDGRSKTRRMEQLSGDFFKWCKLNKRSPILSRLTKESINWENNSSFPSGSWYKGGLTTTCCEFIEAQLRSASESEDPMFEMARDAVIAINTCISMLYKSEAFMDPSTAREVGEQGLRFLRRYHSLAARAVELKRPLWMFIPKAHALHHIFLEDLFLSSQNYSRIVNPVCYSVQMSEDFIGRNSRVARKVHPSLCT